MMDFLRKQMKWVMAIIVVAFLLSTFLMYEGTGTRRTPTRNADGTMSDYEVAQINGRSLMRSELEQRLRSYLNNYSSRNIASLDMPAIYKTVLDNAILESQLDKEVEANGIKISDAQAEQAMKAYADTYFPTRETFYQALEQSGIRPDDYKKSLARQIAIDQLMNMAVGEIEISEDKALEFYDTMKNIVYSKPEGFMIHLANFDTSADAENFRARLVNGESWDIIASSDLSASVDITREPVFLPANAFATGTFSALASLDLEKPSEVFTLSSSDFGVAMKTSHVDASVSPYDEVSSDIRTVLTQQEERTRLSNYQESLLAKANVVINDKELFASPEPESKDTAPEFVIEDITEVSAEPEVKSEEVKLEVKAEEPVSAEPTPEVKEPEEVKTEEPVSAEPTPEVKEPEEVKPEEPVSAEPTPEVKAPEEVKAEEPVSAEPTPEVKEPEEIKAAVEKIEGAVKSIDLPAVTE